MIIGFSKHGKGNGVGVVGYITDGADAVEYVAGGKKSGKVRSTAPVVLRGHPETARRLIDMVPFKWKYTSAVVSFSPGERITPEMERRVMNEFEGNAFSGLDRSRYYTLWVRHTDGTGGGHHLHLVTPRIELQSGKSLNIAPPGKASRELFDTLRSKINAELGLSNPDDPARIQTVRLPRHVAKLQARERASANKGNGDVRVLITRHLEEKVREGFIKNRDDVARHLREFGFTITREGTGYLTIQNSENGQRVRLRGGLYDRDQCAQVISRVCERGQDKPVRNPDRVRALEEKLERLVAARTTHNRERYGPNIMTGVAQSKEKFHDQFGEPIIGGSSRNGAELRRSRDETHRTLDRLGEGTRQLDRTTRSFVQSSRFLDAAIERAKFRQREREADRNLISKYGALVAPPSRSRGLGVDREMEREFV